MFGWLKSFIQKLFDRARPGLDKFIETNLAMAKEIIRTKLSEYAPQAFDQIKRSVRDAILSELHRRGVSSVYDNWIELLIGHAFEHLKRELLDAAQR